MDIRSFDSEYVEKNLDMPGCVELMEDTLLKLHRGGFEQYLRTGQPMPGGNIIAFMPAFCFDGYFGAKILSVFPKNSRDGFPSHQGQILIFDGEHGELKALVDATSVTKIRTGAVSGAASKYLARKDSKILALLGAGEQAESHLKAISGLFALDEVRVWNHNKSKAESFCGAHRAIAGGAVLKAADSAEEAVRGADIICTLTPSKEPVVKYEWIKPGAHINAVGACTKDARELDTETVRRARFFCDSVESVMAEAGDYVIPMNEGAFGKEHLVGTLGQLFAGEIEGRTSDEDITIFESLGLAAEDLAAAKYLMDK
ncbi:MAG: ornithine cyclodeaminase family protein [Firmicutes bacterium]|nr:ornithine cyclodeaminase family protein [Bacillota bacterium]